jgi:hypothetical protein
MQGDRKAFALHPGLPAALESSARPGLQGGVGPSPPALRGPRLDGELGTWEEAVHEYDVHGTDKGGRGGETHVRVHVCACACAFVCVHVFARDMNLAIRALCVPECTAECKRQVTRLTNGTNGADPMASCEASKFLLFERLYYSNAFRLLATHGGARPMAPAAPAACDPRLLEFPGRGVLFPGAMVFFLGNGGTAEPASRHGIASGAHVGGGGAQLRVGDAF